MYECFVDIRALSHVGFSPDTLTSDRTERAQVAGMYHQACVNARSDVLTLVRKEVLAKYGKTQRHKGNCRCSRHCLGESSDISSRLRSNLDGEVELCHSNSRIGQ